MKKIQVLMVLWGMSMMFSCADLDNYDEPGEALIGALIDQSTGEGFITEQPNGFRIQLAEISWSDNPQLEYFWGKADGSFQHTKLFPGTYEVTPVEGAFFPVEATTVKIYGKKEVEFKVIPYLHVKADVKREGANLSVTYSISQTKASDKILDARVFVSDNPNVGSNMFNADLSPLVNLSEIEDKEILSSSFSETITGLIEGKTYYVRVGARTDNANKRYNFTNVIEVK